MRFGRLTHRRASSIVRSLLVSVATLTILLICFAIYQGVQDEPTAAKSRVRRLPETPSRPLTLHDEGVEPSAPAVESGGEPKIGPGEKIKITVYGRDSDRAWFEIAVDDLTPVTGSTNEFLLTAPEIRMRTKSGHAIRVTANRGVLEAERKHGGALDPRRGRLAGSVSIQYDLLSERERADLPEEERGRLDPADVMAITMEEVEFDLEYSKLLVPGALQVLTRDMEFRATDLEARFNDAENRVEYLRVSRGGEMKLRNRGRGIGVGLPGGADGEESALTLTGWMRSWIEGQARSQAAVTQAEVTSRSAEGPVEERDGIPVFRAEGGSERRARAAVRYRVRFEGDVDARQMAGDVLQAHLVSDMLEVLHDLAGEAGESVPLSSGAGEAGSAPAAEAGADDRFELTWSDRLVINACVAGDELCFGSSARKVTAAGSPLRLASSGNDVECRRMTYDPETRDVSAYGSELDLAVARFDRQGLVTGMAIHTSRRGNDLTMKVAGPGRLSTGRLARATEGVRGVQSSPVVAEFAGSLEVAGRIVTRPRLSRDGLIGVSRSRVVDRAVFDGQVTVTQDDTAVSADSMTVGFGSSGGWFREERYIDKIVGRGNVEMTEQEDSMSCRDIDVVFEKDSAGNPTPVVAVAVGEVVVAQADGSSVRAKEKLIIDFETGSGDVGGVSSGDSEQVGSVGVLPVVVMGGGEPDRGGPRIRRLRGDGGVTIMDPARGFDVVAGSFDCSLSGGRAIDSAVVKGEADRPAVVQLDTFTVSGDRITLDVPGQAADVPGAGRLSFRSMRDLDGGRSKEPIPISVSWTEGMTYRGIENRSLFRGVVHAVSAADTTFDCDELLVEFADVEGTAEPEAGRGAWQAIKGIVGRIVSGDPDSGRRVVNRGVSKEPVYVLATGNAVALTSELDAATGTVESRARLAGPRLSVDLRPEASKLVIEGPGSLLLEDNRPFESAHDGESKEREARGLFADGDSDGPSNTLIEWKDLMWYDFGVNQTRFEGDVDLKHFSGLELLKMRPDLQLRAGDVSSGRATYLRSDALTVDFQSDETRSLSSKGRRVGGLSADRLERFQATGSVSLQDESEGMSLSAERVVYWKDREVLGIYGHPRRNAQVAIRRPGRLPHQLSVERLFYNLDTGTWELSKPKLSAR